MRRHLPNTRGKFIRALRRSKKSLRATIAVPIEGLARGATGTLGVVFGDYHAMFYPDTDWNSPVRIVHEKALHCPELGHYQP